MRSGILLILTLISPLGVADVPQRGQNVVVNPGFEEAGDASLAAAWQPIGEGYTLVTEGAHRGRNAIRCESTDPTSVCGAMQEITFDPPIQHPFTVSGWSKAENVRGEDYCLYMDVWYEDGSNLWGQQHPFTRGTHDWERIEYTFEVTKPVTKIQYFILFRRCAGRAWFDDVSLSLTPFRITGRRLVPSLYGGNTLEGWMRLSLPAQWTVSVLHGGQAVYSAEGRGQRPALAWPGTDAAGITLPGGRYTVRIEARDELRGEQLSEETEVTTADGLGQGYVAWTESSMVRVLEGTLPEDSGRPQTAEISLAGNEYESFQVVLRAAPGRDLKDCQVSFGPLRDEQGNEIPADCLSWHQVGFFRIPALAKLPVLPEEAAPGWWPDPLLPVRRFTVPGGTTQALWFTVYAPRDMPAGEYRGQVTITPANAPPTTVSVTATVYGFNLPVQPHIKTAFALMDGYLERIYGEATRDLRRTYGDFVLQHRLNPDDISRTDPPDIDDIAYYYDRGLNAFNVMNMVEPRTHGSWVCWSPLEVYTPEFKLQIIRRLDPYVAELKRRGLADKAYVYSFDERGVEFHPVIREYFGLIKERYGLPTLTTAHVPNDPQIMKDLNVDWNCPLTARYDVEQADRCRAEGLQVWAYVCMGPRPPYANWLADHPLIESRVFWWQAFREKMDGVLYWGLNIWHRANNDYLIDPEAEGGRLRWSFTSGDPGSGWEWLHGDGMLLYPGKDGPIGSIRLANLRDGIEDYEYLWLLGELEGSRDTARAACIPVTTSLTELTHNPEVVATQRHDIARRIEKLLGRSRGA